MVDVNPPEGRRPSLRAERAAVTRHRIADAARILFRRDGYAATTMNAIAREAGVAVQTVYAVYGSKAGILEALREWATTQPEAEALYQRAMADSDPARRLALFARSIRERWQRAGDIVAIHRDAGTTDADLRAGVEATLARRRGGLRALAASLDGAYRPGVDLNRAAAILDALTLYEVYAELVEVQGWTPDAFEAWLAQALVRELLPEGE
jgi:AcrR family transcriptional regulator